MVIMLISVILTFTPSIKAATKYPNKYTYVRAAPYWFCMTIDKFDTSQAITPIEQDGNVGSASASPVNLLLLLEVNDNGWAFVQYVANNTTVDNSVQPLRVFDPNEAKK